jgi:hypothetical protein
MTMWAENIKFVKDIIDSKYSKIDQAVAEVCKEDVLLIIGHFQIAESSEALLKDANCAKSKEHLRFGLRTLELVQTEEIDKLLETIISVSWKIIENISFIEYNTIQDLHGKEKEALEIEAKTKKSSRTDALEKAKQIKLQLKL